jgi:hypothetical protein
MFSWTLLSFTTYYNVKVERHIPTSIKLSIQYMLSNHEAVGLALSLTL